jgi:hypothetical protein
LTTETVIGVDHDPRDFVETAPAGAEYILSNASFAKASFWKSLQADLADYLVASQTVQVWKNPGLKLYSRVGERESDFRARCIAIASEECDKAIASLRDKFRIRIDRVRDLLDSADRRVSDLDQTIAERKQEEIFSGAGDLLGAVLGGRRRNTISRAATRRSQTRQTETRRERAADARADKMSDLVELEADLADEIIALSAAWDGKAGLIEELEIPLERTDVKVLELKLIWVPA